MNALRFAFLSGLLLFLGPARAAAQDDVDPEREVSAEHAADAGAFSPWTMSARTDVFDALVSLAGGYDAARGGAVLDSLVVVPLIDRLSLRGGVSYVDGNGARPIAGAKLDLLRQEDAGVDLAIAGGYEAFGFNLVSAVATNVAIGWTDGRLRLVANVGCGIGLEDGEGYGDMRAAASYRLADWARIGVDSRLRVDLERDAIEPAGEPDWDLAAGPAATFTLADIALTGGVGASAIRRRFASSTSVGPLAYVGVGAVF